MNKLNWVDAASMLQNLILVLAKNIETFDTAVVTELLPATTDDAGTGKIEPQQTRLYLSEQRPGACAP